MTGTDAPLDRRADRPVTPADPPRPRRWPLVLVVVALVGAGFAWFATLGHWWLNSDGSAYLSVGSNFLDTGRFALPDGDTLLWINRPLYPLLLTAPWLVRRSFEASIWMSRLPLILIPPVVAAASFRFTRSWPAAALAGAAALVQPWTLIAGGANFVPDGLTALALLVAVVSASAAVVVTGARRRWWLGAALVAVVVAAGAKEVGLLGLLLVAAVVAVGLLRPPRWMVVLGLVALFVVIVAGLIMVNGATNVGLLELPRQFGDRLVSEPFGGSRLAVPIGLLALFLVVWGFLHCTEPLPLAGLLLVVEGTAVGLYASGSGLGQRNAVLLPYGVCLLLGAFLGATWARMPAVRVGALAGGAVLVALLLAVSIPRAVTADEAAALSWDSAGTRAVGDWLDANARGERSACTLLFCSFVWLSADADLDLNLLPQHGARLGPRSFSELDFGQRAGWRGPVDGKAPECLDRPLVVTKSDERFGAIFECSLLDFVRCAQPRYVVVSGWNQGDTYDAGRLIPYLEANPAFRRVFATAASDWPRVLAVYEVVDTPEPVPDAPVYMSQAAYRALRERPAGARVLDGGEYQQLVTSLLTQPAAPVRPAVVVPGEGVPGDAPRPEGCPTNLGTP